MVVDVCFFVEVFVDYDFVKYGYFCVIIKVFNCYSDDFFFYYLQMFGDLVGYGVLFVVYW